MKALTLWQPWATLIAIGAKTIETRSWETDYRGPLAIHAAKRKLRTDEITTQIARALDDADVRWRDPRGHGMAFGAIVAVCNLSAIFPTGQTQIDGLDDLELADQLPFGDFTPGRYGWQLTDVEPVDVPIFVRGGRRLWGVSDALASSIEDVQHAAV